MDVTCAGMEHGLNDKMPSLSKKKNMFCKVDISEDATVDAAVLPRWL